MSFIEIRDIRGVIKKIRVRQDGDEYIVQQDIDVIAQPAALVHGEKDVAAAATPEALVAAPTPIESMCHIKAKVTNTDTIFIGKDAAMTAANGYPLSPGESVTFEIADLEAVFVRVVVNGEGVNYLAS